MSIDVMKQALEALEYIHTETSVDEDELIHPAITALRAAIEKAQEPFAEVRLNMTGGNAGLSTHIVQLAKGYYPAGTKLYTAPQPKQPEQEPVAWITDGGKGELWWYQSSKFDEEGNLIGYNEDDIPLYTTPRQWQGLTEEEINSLWDDHVVPVFNKIVINPIEGFARAIEAKLREKNHG